MPTYVYRNLVTGETFDVEQRITEDAWTVHPDTGEPVKRLVQPVGIAFKGSGFYVNDSKGGRSTSASAKDASATGAGSEASSSPSTSDSASSAASSSATTSSGASGSTTPASSSSSSSSSGSTPS